MFQSRPNSVFVNGKEYRVRTNFKEWIKISLLAEDPYFNAPQKLDKQLQLCYDMKLTEFNKILTIENIKFFYDAMVDFLNCGVNYSTSSSSNKKIFDYRQDWDYFYAAFMQQYNIDLNTADLHWYDFYSLFKGLTGDTELVKIMEYRNVDITKIKDKEQKKFYLEMQQRFKLKTFYVEEITNGDEFLINKLKENQEKESVDGK